MTVDVRKIGAAISALALTIPMSSAAFAYEGDTEVATLLTETIVKSCQIPSTEVLVRPHLDDGFRLERSPTLSPEQVDCIAKVIGDSGRTVEDADTDDAAAAAPASQ